MELLKDFRLVTWNIHLILTSEYSIGKEEKVRRYPKADLVVDSPHLLDTNKQIYYLASVSPNK